MLRPLSAFLFTVGLTLTLHAEDSDLLIHWTFDEGAGQTTADLSGNGLNGSVGAAWSDSPAGKALAFDGTAERIVKVDIPEALRFGKGSWTFMAMLKPAQFIISDRQNQRRIFAYGIYPDAYLVIDIGGDGKPMCYFCYKNGEGKTVSAGGSTSAPLKLSEWTHLALVCDRKAARVQIYICGYSQGSTAIAAGFDGDYVLGGELTLGNGWHNYHGVMDEVRIYRRALEKTEVRAEFNRLKATFQAEESPEAAAAELRDALSESFRAGNAAWTAGDLALSRSEFRKIVTSPVSPPHFRSYGLLRIAQSFMAESRHEDAKTTYETLAADATVPEVHRFEARECISEIVRASRGLPPRDPAASRVRIPQVDNFAARVFVAPDGNDANDGTAEKPFVTLGRARDAVRALKVGGTKGPIGVCIKPGRYLMAERLELAEADSGTAEAPIVYYAERKGTATFYGGAKLSGFTLLKDETALARLAAEGRGNVFQCDLRNLGITDYGNLAVRGFGQPPSPPTLELYVNGEPMTLARWPNKGFVGIEKLIEPGDRAKGKPSVFQYKSDRPARWTNASDAWLFGYFHFLWADATIKIGAIDTEARTVATAEAYQYGGRSMDTRQGIAYYAFNLLEEIDEPGEWYLDRDTGMLYLYPTSDPVGATIEIGMLSTPMITMTNVSHVRIEGLVFDLARYNCMRIENCSDCLVAGCTVSRMAGNGITITGGTRNGILGCDIHTIGRRATEVIGGDRETLTPANHFVENCQIHDFGRIDRTYTPAIQLEGVGNRVAHNLMYNCPSSTMRIEGNDHLIEFNEVHSAVRESDDQGAMELFRNATYRGVVFRYNHIHHVGKTGSEAAVHGQAGIRFDDAISGMLVYGNVFYRSANGHFGAIQMNSGRDNLMDNNIFADCKQGISGGWNAGNNVWKMLRAGESPQGFYTNDLYLSRYPQLATMLDSPGINSLWRNVFYRCGVVTTRSNNIHMFENGVFPESDPGFVDAVNGDFRLKPDAPLFRTVGFRQIPIDEIGLYSDRFRATWPVVTKPVRIPDWRR